MVERRNFIGRSFLIHDKPFGLVYISDIGKSPDRRIRIPGHIPQSNFLTSYRRIKFSRFQAIFRKRSLPRTVQEHSLHHPNRIRLSNKITFSGRLSSLKGDAKSIY